MKILKRTLFIALIIFIVLAGINHHYDLIHGMVMPTHTSFVSKIEVKENHILMSGGTADSAHVFCGFDYRVEGDKALVRLRYSLPSRFHTSGSYKIDICKDTENIKYIYLAGKTKSDSVLLWEKDKSK